MSDEKDISNGHKALAELERTEAAFAKLRTNALEAIAQSRPGEPTLVERLICTVQTLDAVRDELMREVAFGQAAQFRRDQD
jgi:hypothetical protein